MPKLSRSTLIRQHRRAQQGGYGAYRRYQIHPRRPAAATGRKTDRKFLDKALSDYRDARKGLDDLAKPSEKAIHPQYLAQQISHFADDDAIFTCDVGTPTVWAARYLKMNGKRRLLGSFNHGSMANAMPQALGAKATAPERQVVAMCGDGGFSMLMGISCRWRR